MKRECGECTMCCLVLEIPALKKAVNERCKRCDPKNGCTIYDKRPKPCQTFECVWLKDDLPEDMRPDKCGVLFEPVGDNIRLALVDPDRPDAWKAVMETILEFQEGGYSIAISGGPGKVRGVLLAEGITLRQFWTDIANSTQVVKKRDGKPIIYNGFNYHRSS